MTEPFDVIGRLSEQVARDLDRQMVCPHPEIVTSNGSMYICTSCRAGVVPPRGGRERGEFLRRYGLQYPERRRRRDR